ncbi:MAG TPA: four helix bundle protein [Lacunisphaera sp.]|nr:four helix bundle protein [Lacunisphaera sp.]
MPVPLFDHERLKAYQEALHFVGWIEPLLERLPGKLAAKDQLDRASTSVVLNLAEGNGKRSALERCRFFDIARGSAVECAACLDVLRVKGRVTETEIAEGKTILLEVVSTTAGLIARFSCQLHEEPAGYLVHTGIEETEKD